MGWKLCNDLSFCRVGGRFVFLDTGRDRYFRLPELQERAFAALVDGYGADEALITCLSDQHILEESPEPHSVPQAASISTVTRSAIEEAIDHETPGVRTLAEVLSITYATSRQLKRNRLKSVLDHAASYRRHRVARAARTFMKRTPIDTHRASAVFAHARAFSPIDTICLLDSLSMLKFLANRGIHADLVLAVTSDPFSAHCWVQAGDTVLNDTVGSAHAHTPIWIL